MELFQIRYFLTLSQTLNFTRAAEACHVTQPAFTRAIKALEDELGGELIRRERSNTHLTELGRRMLPMLQQCHDSANLAKKIAEGVANTEIAPLSIALSNTVSIETFLPFFAELFGAFPGLQLRILRGSSETVQQLLMDGDAEIAIAGSLATQWSRLDSWALFDDRIRLLIRASDDLAKQVTLSAEDLRGRCLLVQSKLEMRQGLTDWCRKTGLNLEASHKVDTSEDLAALVEAGLGIALAPASQQVKGSLVQRDVVDLDVTRPVFLYSVAGRPRSPVAGTLSGLLRARDWAKAA